jgi:hypothetical protein
MPFCATSVKQKEQDPHEKFFTMGEQGSLDTDGVPVVRSVREGRNSPQTKRSKNVFIPQ